MFAELISGANGLIWSIPLIALCLLAGVYFTIRTGLLQVRNIPDMLAQLKKGDRVMTSGGIYGTVAQVEDQIVWVKIADTLKVKMAKSAITGVVADTEGGKDQGSAA